MALPEGPDGAMLSGAAIAGLQRQAEMDMLRRYEAIRIAQAEAIQLAVHPAWNDNLVPDGNRSVMSKWPDPRLAAEKLLRSVLPEDLCISLSAIGECEVQGKKYRYRIFKGKKTHCFQGDKTFSCCIELSDSQAPDTDRIIAEYLLIKNNEDEYLKTANLTQIAGPQEGLRGRDIGAIANDEGHAIDAMRYAMGYGRAWIRENTLGQWPPIGATIRVRRPPRYELNGTTTPPRMIIEGILMNLRNDDRMRGRRWPVLAENEQHQRGLHREFLHIGLPIDDADLTRSFDELNSRVLRRTADQLARTIADRPNIVAFFQVPAEQGFEARHLDYDTGIDISYVRRLDVREYRVDHQIVAGILLR